MGGGGDGEEVWEEMQGGSDQQRIEKILLFNVKSLMLNRPALYSRHMPNNILPVKF